MNKASALRIAEMHALKGEYLLAIAMYSKIAVTDPKDSTIINVLGDLYVRTGMIPEAIARFSQAAHLYIETGFTGKAVAVLKKVLKLEPGNLEATSELASLYWRQGLLAEARERYFLIAETYMRSGETDKVIETYQKIADMDPSNVAAWMNLGEGYSSRGSSDKAHNAFLTAGTEFLRRGKIEDALDAHMKALAADPDSYQAPLTIAKIYIQQDQTDRAVEVLCQTLERYPADVTLLDMLGCAYLAAGLMDEAEQTFLGIVVLDPGLYDCVLRTAQRFLELNDLDRAAEQIDACIDMMLAEREEQKAIDLLRQILDRDKNHIGSLKRLAEIHSRLREDYNLIAILKSLAEAAICKGNDDEAIAALKELAELEPDEQTHRQRLQAFGVQMEPRPFVKPASECGLVLYESSGSPLFEDRVPEIKGETGFVIFTGGDRLSGESVVERLPESAGVNGPLVNAESRDSSDLFLEGVPVSLNADLEYIDFLLEQGYVDTVRQVLDSIRNRQGDHPEIMLRYDMLDNSSNHLPDTLTESQSSNISAPDPDFINGISRMKEIFKADMLARQGHIEQAAARLREIIKSDPDNALARLKLRQIYLQIGMTKLATDETLQLARIQHIYSEAGRSVGFVRGSQSEPIPDPVQATRQPSRHMNGCESEFEAALSNEKRMLKRMALSLPLLAIQENISWQEFTESLNANQNGMMFRLMHPVQVGMRLQIKTPMPRQFRIHSCDKRIYEVGCVVRHRAGEEFGWNLVGVDFGFV